MSTDLGEVAGVFNLTQFYGGAERGISLQVSQTDARQQRDGCGYIQLTVDEARELAGALAAWVVARDRT